MLDEYMGIRSRLTDDLNSAWALPNGSLIWLTKQSVIPNVTPVVWIQRLPNVSLAPLGTNNDEALIKFLVGGRFPIREGMDYDQFAFEQIDKIRPYLSYSHYTACGYKPLITEFSYQDVDPGDLTIELSFRFQVSMVATRSGAGGE